MFYIRKAKERGYADHGWLKSYHTFSFADYYDQRFMGFGPLLVINEDFIAGAAGFPTHGHKDMEIFTYPIRGAVAHKDSTGASGVIYPYEIQKMSAGKGITHSEYNHMSDQETHLLQIWIQPSKKSLEPYYEQKNFKEEINSFQPVLILSPNGEGSSFKIFQDAKVWVKKTRVGDSWELDLNSKRHYWVQVVHGELNSNSMELRPGDGLAIGEETKVLLKSITESEVIFFDLP